MDLTYKGFSIGKINGIKLDGSMVRVDYYVLGEYEEYVRENSLVQFAVSPIGLGSSFKLHPGKSERLLESGSEIYRSDSPQGLELIAQEKNTIVSQTDSIGILMNKVSVLLDNVNSLLSNVNTAVEGKGETSLRKILDNVVVLTGNLNGVLALLSSSDGAVPKLLGPELSGEISTVLTNLTSITDDFSSLAGNADKIVEKAAPEIDTALGQLNTVLVQVQDVLTGVKNNPLIRGGVPDRSAESSATTHLRSTEF